MPVRKRNKLCHDIHIFVFLSPRSRHSCYFKKVSPLAQVKKVKNAAGDRMSTSQWKDMTQTLADDHFLLSSDSVENHAATSTPKNTHFFS
jgi:hypothetical protein